MGYTIDLMGFAVMQTRCAVINIICDYDQQLSVQWTMRSRLLYEDCLFNRFASGTKNVDCS